MKKLYTNLILLVCTTVFVGCSREYRSGDLPKLTPMAVASAQENGRLSSAAELIDEEIFRPIDKLLDESYQKWIWIELIGFDNTLSDYGVQNYLERCQFLPDGASLLLTWTEFVLGYQGMDHEYELHPNEQSYGGHPASPERKRQNWTNYQLKGLVDMKAEIESVKCLTKYEGFPLFPVGTTFQCRVAGRGADVFDVVLK